MNFPGEYPPPALDHIRNDDQARRGDEIFVPADVFHHHPHSFRMVVDRAEPPTEGRFQYVAGRKCHPLLGTPREPVAFWLPLWRVMRAHPNSNHSGDYQRGQDEDERNRLIGRRQAGDACEDAA